MLNVYYLNYKKMYYYNILIINTIISYIFRVFKYIINNNKLYLMIDFLQTYYKGVFIFLIE